MKKKSSILIIRFSAMGDVALTVPVIKNFAKTYPEAQITLLTKSFFHPFFDGIPNLSLPIVDLKGKHKGFLGLRQLVKELTTNQKFDAVIDLHSVLRSWTIGFLFKLKGISVYKIDKGRREKKAFLQDITKAYLPHSTERYQLVFKKAGFSFELDKALITPKEDKPSIELNKKTINIGLAPFAAHKSKQWGLNRVTELIETLNKNYRVHFYLFGGGQSEVTALDKIANNYTNVKNLAGKFNLRQEMYSIQSLNAMICMDSGNMHIATLLGIPVISIWGGTHPGAGFGALYQPKENSIQLPEKELKNCKLTVFGTSENQIENPPYFCINTIQVKQVVTRLQELKVL